MSTRKRELAVRPALVVLALVSIAWLVSAQERRAPQAEQAAPRTKAPAAESRHLPRPVVDTHHLMELFNQPLYDLLHQEVQRVDQPQEKTWETIGDRGLQAAEVANLISMRQYKNADQNQWRELASHLQQAGIDLAEAAKEQNAGRVKTAYVELIGRCNACHNTMAPERAPDLKPFPQTARREAPAVQERDR